MDFGLESAANKVQSPIQRSFSLNPRRCRGLPVSFSKMENEKWKMRNGKCIQPMPTEHSRNKFIAESVDREDELRVARVHFYFLSQPCYVNIHRARCHFRIVSPYFAQEFIAR